MNCCLGRFDHWPLFFSRCSLSVQQSPDAPFSGVLASGTNLRHLSMRLDKLSQVFPFVDDRQLLRICFGPLISQSLTYPGLPARHQADWMVASCVLRLVPIALPRFSLVAYTLAYQASPGRIGTSPVKLANHFLEVNPPNTVAFDRQLTVLAVGRRPFDSIAMLHRNVGAGTPPGPNRESSPSLVPWLLRCHIYSDTSCIPPLLKFGEQVLNQYGPAQVGFGYHF